MLNVTRASELYYKKASAQKQKYSIVFLPISLKLLHLLFQFTQLPDEPTSNPVIFSFGNCGKEKRS